MVLAAGFLRTTLRGAGADIAVGIFRPPGLATFGVQSGTVYRVRQSFGFLEFIWPLRGAFRRYRVTYRVGRFQRAQDTHSVKGTSLLPAAFFYPDRATAEQYARAAIDVQLSGRRR